MKKIKVGILHSTMRKRLDIKVYTREIFNSWFLKKIVALRCYRQRKHLQSQLLQELK